MGPTLLTADEVPNVGELTVTTVVNGEQPQHGRVRDMIFDIPYLMETLSRGMLLLPGDIIATGTPYGIGASFVPPRFLQPGDTVAISIPGIGELINPVA
jgi:2-keto-4-pentenoate hydratase/2-oxohepta-3-ene-1,7-dioic acid hydratase in catechol pathway